MAEAVDTAGAAVADIAVGVEATPVVVAAVAEATPAVVAAVTHRLGISAA
jgi:hypothetical protein